MSTPPRRRIEVLLCTYNGARFVAAQIESILAQTRPVDLLSIYDDASTDATMAVVETIAAAHRRCGRAPEIRLQVRERNLGYGRNFWNAIGRSQGDLLFLCDQDDVWHPSKVALLESVFDDPHVGLAFSDGDITGPDGERLTDSGVLAAHGLRPSAIGRFTEDPLRELLRRNCINGAAAALRGNLARGAPPLPDGMPHDHWLAMWCCASDAGIACLSARLYGYRQHGANAIGVGGGKRLHKLVGMWRSAWIARERERWMYDLFAQWQHTRPPTRQLRRIAAKQAWRAGLVDTGQTGAALAARIAFSMLTGRYRRFGTRDGVLRDVFRLAHAR